jgi:hypothetical protein
VELLQAQVSSSESAARAAEASLRGELDQIMKLWEEAQRTNAVEMEQLQERIMELKEMLAKEREIARRLQAREEEDKGYI